MGGKNGLTYLLTAIIAALGVATGVLAVKNHSNAKQAEEYQTQLASVETELEEKTKELADITQSEGEEASKEGNGEEMSQISSELEKQKELNSQTESELEKQKELNSQTESELEKQRELNAQQEAEYQDKLEELEEKLEQIAGVRETIIEELEEKFSDTDLNLVVDKESGIVSVNSNILFAPDSSTLSEEGCALLRSFFPEYCDIILDPETKDYVSEIIVEGHTDNIGNYFYNLYLSQMRALAVSQFCLKDIGALMEEEKVEAAREMLTANGRSYSAPVYQEDGTVDLDASRRVEIKFRLLSEELLQGLAK